MGWTAERGVEHLVGGDGDQARDGFVYLGGMVPEDWVQRVMMDRKI